MALKSGASGSKFRTESVNCCYVGRVATSNFFSAVIFGEQLSLLYLWLGIAFTMSNDRDGSALQLRWVRGTESWYSSQSNSVTAAASAVALTAVTLTASPVQYHHHPHPPVQAAAAVERRCVPGAVASCRGRRRCGRYAVPRLVQATERHQQITP